MSTDQSRLEKRAKGIEIYQDALTRFLVHHLNADVPTVGLFCMADFKSVKLELETKLVDTGFMESDLITELFVVGKTDIHPGAEVRYAISLDKIDDFMIELFTEWVKGVA
jgi:coenzyme F420-reducing hydrogenase beta subunit